MGSTINKAILIGRLGRDPELRTTGTGKSVCNFSIATDDGTKENPETTWHRIVAWGKTAELCAEYLSKGRMCYVEGRTSCRKYTDRDGNEKTSTEVVAFQVTFLGGREDSQTQPAEVVSRGNGLGYTEDPDKDLPF